MPKLLTLFFVLFALFATKTFAEERRNISVSAPVPAQSSDFQAEVSTIGYKDHKDFFTIWRNQAETYPEIGLKPNLFNIVTSIRYSFQSFTHVLVSIVVDSTLQLTKSLRFADLLYGASILLLALFLIASLSIKTHIPVLSFPVFLYSAILSLFPLSKGTIHGRVVDKETDNPLSNAQVYIIDSKNNLIAFHTHTNTFGEFYIKHLKIPTYKGMVRHSGYESSQFLEFDTQASVSLPLKIRLLKRTEGNTAPYVLIQTFKQILGACFEVMLILILVLELTIGFSRGWTPVAPFLAGAALNIGLFLFLLAHHTKQVWQ